MKIYILKNITYNFVKGIQLIIYFDFKLKNTMSFDNKE